MNNKRWHAGWINRIFAAAALAASLTGQMTRGQEEAPPLPPEHRAEHVFEHRAEHVLIFDAREMRAIERAGETLLAEIGPGHRLTVTKELMCGAANCSQPAVSPCQEFCVWDDPEARFVKAGCPCVAGGECHCGDACRCLAESSLVTEASCGSECLASCTGRTCEARCGEGACDIALAHAEEAAEHHHEHHRIHLAHEHLDVVHHLVDLVADRAAARAELESRKEASAKMSNLYETLAELLAANAALEAKLEAQIEHTKLAVKLGELAAENARLRTHVELAGTRSEANQQTISLTLENERLKLRLADLEHRQVIHEPSRTADRPLRDRKSR